jgi:hypothetical protein
MEIKKGQKIWVWRQTRGVTETVVTLVGRKYIYVENPSKTRFRVSDLNEEDSAGFSSYLILDIDKYKHDLVYDKLRVKLNRFDKWHKVSEEKLTKIENILNEYF